MWVYVCVRAWVSVCVCVSKCVWLFFFLFFELLIVATMLMTASCSCMTSFNHGDKKTRDIGLICRCHLSNIKPDSLFYGSMFQWMTCPFLLLLFVVLFVFLLVFIQGVVNTIFPRLEEIDEVSCYYNNNGHGKTASCGGLRKVGLISFWWGSNSRTSLRIL